MKIVRLSLGSILFLALLASASLAQVQRTFASASGSDGNPCSRSAPCRTLGQAISQTNVGGEVVILDSAGYGPVNITKSITVTAAPGVYAGISVFSGDGIDVNAASSDVVTLHGLTVNNQGSSGSGIVCNTAGTLRIESCIVRGFNVFGLGVGFFSAGNFLIKDSIISDCGSAVLIEPFSGAASVSLDHLSVDNCGFGVFIQSNRTTAVGVIRDSSVMGSDTGIIMGANGAGALALLDIERCVISNGGHGLESGQDSGGVTAMSISNCVITHNSNAGFVVLTGATIFSRGNNTIGGNGPNTGSLTPSPGQ